MKEAVFVVLMIFLIIAVFVAITQSNDARNLRLQLASEAAVVATGACGTQFVVSGLGENKDQSAVAGRIVQTTEVSNYVQKENADGLVEVYENKSGREDLVIRRQKRQ